MIPRFASDTALLLIDVQQGVDDLAHWGGPTGRRNNPRAEDVMLGVLDAWRDAGMQVGYTCHNSREAASPLQFALPGGAQKPGFEIGSDDIMVVKNVNSGFVGTPLELELRRAGITRLVVAGFFTNMCVETTVRMAGNLGFDTYLVHDGCATSNRIGVDGTDYEPETVHDLAVASMNGEFCTAISGADAIRLLADDADHLDRVQGNEVASSPTRTLVAF